MQTNTVSSLTICQNEESYIAHMLDFLIEFVNPDEIVIIDGGSTDDTLWIINCYIRNGAPIKLIKNPMPDSFTEQRNLALKNCSGDWILHIDVDETYSKNITGLIEDVRQGKHDSNLGIVFPTAHLIQDEFHMNDNGGDIHIRLFKNISEVKFKGDVHEQLHFNDLMLIQNRGAFNIASTSEVALRHYSMLKNKTDLINKGKRYLRWTEKSQKAGIPLTDDEEFFIKAIEKRINQGALIEVPEKWQ